MNDSDFFEGTDKMSVKASLKVFTLNSWGLPFPVICKNRIERISALGDFLNRNDFDIIVLEEIWVKSDFHHLREKLSRHLPHSHYFYSGTVGSGICVFSKHLILETFFYRFHLNGHAHKIFHGDWFGGKGVGLCKLSVEGLKVNVYCSHFHAEYNPENDEYQAHRLAQAFELSQFIRATSALSDLIILAGDLNINPHSIGYRMVSQNAELKDSWVEKANEVKNSVGGTCDVPGNTYTGDDTVKLRPHGARIDYILFKGRQNYLVEVTECCTGIGKSSETNLSYSDHEAVVATLKISKPEDEAEKSEKTGMSKELRETLQDALGVLDKGITRCLAEENFFKVFVFFISVLLYFVNAYVDIASLNSGFLFTTAVGFTKLALAIGAGFSFWTAMIVKRAEFHGLVATKEDISKLLASGAHNWDL